MFSCCSAPKHVKLLTAGLALVGAILCFFAVVPVYLTTLSSPISKFADCIECGSQYTADVINEINGTAIVDKIIHNHDENEGHHGSANSTACIKEEDLEGLKFEDLDVDPLPRDCVDLCAPVMSKAFLAAGCAGATCFAAIILLICSLAACCSFCCCNQTEPPTYVMVDNTPPSTSHVSMPPPPTGTATSYADALKAPLLPDEV